MSFGRVVYCVNSHSTLCHVMTPRKPNRYQGCKPLFRTPSFGVLVAPVGFVCWRVLFLQWICLDAVSASLQKSLCLNLFIVPFVFNIKVIRLDVEYGLMTTVCAIKDGCVRRARIPVIGLCIHPSFSQDETRLVANIAKFYIT